MKKIDGNPLYTYTLHLHLTQQFSVAPHALENQRLAWLWRLFFGIIGEMSRVVAALTKEGEMK